MRIKKLAGKKCYLSPIDVNDAEKYAEWLNDREIVNFLSIAAKSISVETERELLHALSKEHCYGIIDTGTETLIGNIGLHTIDYLNRSAEIGIFIGNKDYWSNGYGAEALSLLIDYAYRILNIHNISLKLFDYNERALKCYQAVGFQKIGAIRDGLIRNMEYHNIILMDILPTEFYEKNPQYKQEK